jgi:hypothetical protein
MRNRITSSARQRTSPTGSASSGHRPSSVGWFSMIAAAVFVTATCWGASARATTSPDTTVPVPQLEGEPVDEGSVVVVTPDGVPMDNGGSATPFSLLLPEGAACPGDSASKNWYVQSFLIPVDDDPGTIEYGVIGPEGDQFPLYAFDTRPYAHQLTRVSSSPDDPGVIPLLPELTFSVFPPEYIPAGEYRIGIACTFFRQTARYWDTEIVIARDPTDEPAQITWRLPAAEPYVAPSESRPWLVVVLIGVGLAALGVFFALRRQPRTDQRLRPRSTDRSSSDDRSAISTPTLRDRRTDRRATPSKDPR